MYHAAFYAHGAHMGYWPGYVRTDTWSGCQWYTGMVREYIIIHLEPGCITVYCLLYMHIYNNNMLKLMSFSILRLGFSTYVLSFSTFTGAMYES